MTPHISDTEFCLTEILFQKSLMVPVPLKFLKVYFNYMLKVQESDANQHIIYVDFTNIFIMLHMYVNYLPANLMNNKCVKLISCTAKQNCS